MANLYVTPHHSNRYIFPIISNWMKDYFAQKKFMPVVADKLSLYGTNGISVPYDLVEKMIDQLTVKCEMEKLYDAVSRAISVHLQLPKVQFTAAGLRLRAVDDHCFTVSLVIDGVLSFPMFYVDHPESKRGGFLIGGVHKSRVLQAPDYELVLETKDEQPPHDRPSFVMVTLVSAERLRATGPSAMLFNTASLEGRSVLVYSDSEQKVRAYVSLFLFPNYHYASTIYNVRDGVSMHFGPTPDYPVSVAIHSDVMACHYFGPEDFDYVAPKAQQSWPVAPVQALAEVKVVPQPEPIQDLDEDGPPSVLQPGDVLNLGLLSYVISTEMAEGVSQLTWFQISQDFEKAVGNDHAGIATSKDYRDDYMPLQIILSTIADYDGLGNFSEPVPISPYHGDLQHVITRKLTSLVNSSNNIDGFADQQKIQEMVENGLQFNLVIKDRVAVMTSSPITLADLVGGAST